MKKLNKLVSIIITISCLFLVLNSNVYATGIEIGEYSKEYEEWLSLPEETRKNTIAPLPVNIKLEEKNIIGKFRSLLKSTAIPESYDLRDIINVEIKDQMSTGECWAFASNTMIETYLALNGEEENFSERHLEYATATNFIDGENPEGLDREIGDGGYPTTSFTYYSRGNGPIYEDDMPFENNEREINLYELPKNVAVKKVDNMKYFPNIYKYFDSEGNLIYTDANGTEYTQSQVQEIRNSVKKHIMEYGAVTVDVKASSQMFGYAQISENVNSNSENSDHAVVIIGWDDTYSKDNFENKPSTDGAYIVLNSWGENWGENGVYYISYEDLLVERTMRGITGVSDIEYDNIYQYDTTDICNYVIAQYAGNVFTAEENEKLTEIMVGTLSNEVCDIYINTSGDELTEENLTLIASNVSLSAGYTTVEIEDDITISKGDKFAVVVKLTNENYLGIGIENNTSTISNSGESFISSDGINWFDMYNEEDMMNVSIKVYAQSEEKSLNVSEISGKVYQDVGGAYNFDLETSYVDNGQDVNIVIYKDGQDVTEQINIDGNYVRGKGAYVTLSCDSTIQEGTYSVEISVDGYETVTREFTVDGNESLITAQFNDPVFADYVANTMSTCLYDSINLTIKSDKSEFEKILELSYIVGGIQDITGIEYFTNLQKINFNGSNISDISPISNLTNLKSLELQYAILQDLSVLESLINLEALDLSFVNLENNDLSYLSNLNNLKILCLNGLDISGEDLIKIKDLTTLEQLQLAMCNLDNIENLSELTNIKSLLLHNSLEYGGNNHIEDITPIYNMTNLQYFNVGYQLIEKEIIGNRENIELPKIFQEATDENNLLYSESGLLLENCTWNEEGKSINLDEGVENATIVIGDGFAAQSVLNINYYERAVENIRIKNNPDKMIYRINDYIDLTGLVLEVEYNDGTVEEITDGYTVDIEHLTEVGTTEITITYREQSTTLEVTVEDYTGLVIEDGVIVGYIPEYILNENSGFFINLYNIPQEEKSNIEVSISDETIAEINEIDLCEFEGGENYICANINFIGLGEVTLTVSLEYNGETYTDSYTFTVQEEPSPLYTITISGDEIVNIGKTTELNAEAEYKLTAPEDVTTEVEWTSSDETIATIDENGVVTGIEEGTVTITATYIVDEIEYTATYDITVEKERKITIAEGTVVGEKIEYILNEEDAFFINLTNIPKEEKANIQVTSSDKEIVEITSIDLCESEDGSTDNLIIANLKFVGLGEVTITATLDYNGRQYTDSYTFTVQEEPSPVLYIEGNNTVEVEKTIQLSALLEQGLTTPENITSNVIWTTSDETIATINESGLVTGVSEGTVTIIATYVVDEIEYTATYDITVEPRKGILIAEGTQMGQIIEYVLNEEDSFMIYLSNIPKEEKANVEVTISDETISEITSIDLCEWEDGSGDNLIIANLKFVGLGEVTITASLEYNGSLYTDSYTFTVQEEPTPRYQLIISGEETVEEGKTIQLTAEACPILMAASDVTTEVEWTTSDETIATIDENGLVTGVSEGTVTITAKYVVDEIEYTATYEIDVLPAETPENDAEFGYTVEDGYVLGVNTKTPVESFKTEFLAESGYNLIIKVNDEIISEEIEYVATGMTIEVINENNEIVLDSEEKELKLTIIVTGDITGDGQANGYDTLKIKAHRNEIEGGILEGYELKAADINNDGYINFTDSKLLLLHRAEVEGYDLNFKE